jgi:hypothetical protein
MGDSGAMDAGSPDAPKDKQEIDSFMPGCDMTMACDGMKPDPMANCVVKFDTQLVDVAGAPITTEKLFLCGTNICTEPLVPDATGKISKYTCTWFIRGAAKYLGETRFASFTSLAPSVANVTIAPLTLVPLPAMGVDIPTSGTITSNMVSLTLAANTVVKFDPSEAMDADLHRFRAVQVPAGKFPPGTPANVEVVWGLAPVNASLVPSAQLTVPNVSNWPKGTVVQFYLNGVDGFDTTPPVPYGSWTQIGTGKVDNVSGTTVVTDTGVGNGLPMIGMVGLHHM